jgi:hypothetical protein
MKRLLAWRQAPAAADDYAAISDLGVCSRPWQASARRGAICHLDTVVFGWHNQW